MRLYILCFWSALVLLLAADKISAQATAGHFGTVGIKGMTVLFMRQPVSSNSEMADWYSASDDVIHRVLYDKGRGLNFGYDVRLEPVEGSTKVKVSVEPISPNTMTRVMESFDRIGKVQPEPSDIRRSRWFFPSGVRSGQHQPRQEHDQTRRRHKGRAQVLDQALSLWPDGFQDGVHQLFTNERCSSRIHANK